MTNGNPNGDPDAGNMPRLDPETSHGLVTDVSIKRKVRNYAEFAKAGIPGFGIYVSEGAILNDKHRQAYQVVRPGDEKVSGSKKLNPRDDDEARRLRDFMCQNFFDIRTFGAVMSTGINCGQVRGPVQVTFSRSVEPIVPVEISITRMAATNEVEKKKQIAGADEDERHGARTMARKHIVPYGLYRAHGFISANLAQRTGFSNDDLEFLWDALANMFEHDRSAARGEMASRRLVVFRHDGALGNAPAHSLFNRVVVGREVDGEMRRIGDERLDNAPPARSYSDYRVELDQSGMPAGVAAVDVIEH